MNKNVLIVLIGGFVVAILVAVLVQASLGGKKTDDVKKTLVLVAAKNLPLGANLAEGDLKWQAWPGTPFEGAIIRKGEQKPEEALAGRLISRVSAGQPVLTSYTFREGRGNIVAATLEKGMRAVAIPVKSETMAGGFISPGDYVDVILTYRVRPDSADGRLLVNEMASETILKNIKVLAVDQEAARAEDTAKIAKTVTVAVDTAGAEKVALSAEMGDLTISLRGLGDDSMEDTSSSTTDVQNSRVMQDLAIIQNGGAGGAVKIYSGDKIVEQRPRGNILVNGSEEREPSGNQNQESAGDTLNEGANDQERPQ